MVGKVSAGRAQQPESEERRDFTTQEQARLAWATNSTHVGFLAFDDLEKA